jgi:hypothetical protein
MRYLKAPSHRSSSGAIVPPPDGDGDSNGDGDGDANNDGDNDSDVVHDGRCGAITSADATVARLLVTDNFIPMQQGHPWPRPMRLFGLASHSWSGPSGHSHQYFLFV